jgi:N-acetylglutamate synthase-like GNAT family acetyltransferase
MIKVSSATLDHVLGIVNLIKKFHSNALLLERSFDDVSRNISSFCVAVLNGVVIGCCSLYIYSQELSEIRSLAVDNEYHGQGIGNNLINYLEKEATVLGVKKLFALTLVPKFFIRNNYKLVSKDTLPEKIYRDCINCPSFDNCTEVAMVKII